MARHHGFTCPNCGSHMFGTHTHLAVMGDKHPAGASIGSCREHHHSNSDCRFQWNRDDPLAEAQCMHEQTPAEWQASFQEFIAGPKPSASAV